MKYFLRKSSFLRLARNSKTLRKKVRFRGFMTFYFLWISQILAIFIPQTRDISFIWGMKNVFFWNYKNWQGKLSNAQGKVPFKFKNLPSDKKADSVGDFPAPSGRFVKASLKQGIYPSFEGKYYTANEGSLNWGIPQLAVFHEWNM